MSMKNSPSRIAKRRKSALVRREANLHTWKQHLSGVESPGPVVSKETAETKIKTCETDIANLRAKNVSM